MYLDFALISIKDQSVELQEFICFFQTDFESLINKSDELCNHIDFQQMKK